MDPVTAYALVMVAPSDDVAQLFSVDEPAVPHLHHRYKKQDLFSNSI